MKVKELHGNLDNIKKIDKYQSFIFCNKKLRGFLSFYNHYSTISVTLPAPTVRPPSRIENLVPCSSAIE